MFPLDLHRNIFIDSDRIVPKPQSEIISEELGHFHTSSGNILDLTEIRNRKQELRVRQWAYCKLIPLSRIVDGHKAHVKGRHEIADYLGVTEEFLQAAIDRYRDQYGLCTILDGRYIIYFDPLGVAEMFIDT
ncbi:ImmA/IrrE family metallo-endopeptidase [Paenibacillus elgii]|uniref:ImmA/IrrE family metallo-endopeptidase n=1 Tax=Paenibacillus elgii TaxID=189691 RepID=UPI0013D42813|nr:ImmA/IrrE family metallo-endopeptidase [Paenibacillus elgii]